MDISFQERRDETRRFLELLWGNCTRSGNLGLFFIPGFKSLHLPSDDLDAAAHEIAQASLDEGTHVYLNTCLLSEASRDKPGRGSAADALMIAGVWADVDIAGPSHKSDALPPDQETAVGLCMSLALPPTLIVDSGHGLYPWWLFDQARRLADEDGRDRAHRLVQGAQQALSAAAAPFGWSLDHTPDLARILRPPGTVNCKDENDPRPVRILHEAGIRYTPAQLSEAWAAFTPKPKERARPLPDRITAGNRTNSITSLAGTMLKRNVVEEATVAAALEHNRITCDPPLPTDKVRETVRGIYTRYEPDGQPLTNGAAKSTGAAKKTFLRPFSDIKAVPMQFIWKPRILQGHLTLLAGDPGMGKGLIATALVAAITGGVASPDGDVPDGSVLWVSYEESEASAIRPRLEVARADTRRVYQFVMPQEDGTEDKRFRPADIPVLRELLGDTPDIRLIVLDPIVSYLGAERDINQPNQVRAVLEPLVTMANAMGAGILGIAHINKSELSKALYRVSNSGAFVQVARSVLGVGELKDGRRALAHIKANYSKKAAVIPYDTIGVPYPGFEETVGRVVWDAPDGDLDPFQIFDSQTSSKEERGESRTVECGKAIVRILDNGPRPTSEVRALLVQQGFSRDAINGGKDWAGVVGTGAATGRIWALPLYSHTHTLSEDTEGEEETPIDLTESETDGEERKSVCVDIEREQGDV